MTTRRLRKARWVAVIAAMLLTLTACGDDDTGGTTTTPPTTAGGTQTTAGATTTAPADLPLNEMPMDQLYQLALEEGSVTVYGGASIMPIVFPIFSQQYPGIEGELVDVSSTDLMARAAAEAAGGQVIGDVWQSPMDDTYSMFTQDLLLEVDLPEAADYPSNLKGTYWVGTELQFLGINWNLGALEGEEPPSIWEDLADPRFSGRIIADERDAQLLLTLALTKYADDPQQAIAVFEGIAANNPQFFRGRRGMSTDQIATGAEEICFTCMPHIDQELINEGAPIGYSLEEGVGLVIGTAVMKDSPHPAAAMLFARWIASEEGARAWADAGRVPAHPNVDPDPDLARQPETIWIVSPEELAANIEEYTEIWQDIFGLR